MFLSDARKKTLLRVGLACAGVIFVFFLLLSGPSAPQRLETALLEAPQDGKYRIAIVADLDVASKVDSEVPTWKSIMKTGTISYKDRASVVWDQEDLDLFSHFSEAGRSMELSELVRFNNRLLTFDDRTGLVLEVTKDDVVPRFVLMEGDGNVAKGFKTEWATVKDELLFVGSFGKEYVNIEDGTIRNHNNLWVKTIDKSGSIAHINWTEKYAALRKVTDTLYPGYMIHEAVCWSPKSRKWVFLPRRVSKEPYEEKADETRGSNIMLVASENFDSVKKFEIGTVVPERGFSSCKFLPGSKDEILVVLKSAEDASIGMQKSFISMFRLDGTILLPDTQIPGDVKFEGLEFVSTVM